MGERFRYYVPFLAYVAGPEHSYVVPGYEFYETSSPIETADQVKELGEWLNEHFVVGQTKFITVLDWKRIF